MKITCRHCGQRVVYTGLRCSACGKPLQGFRN